MTGFSLTNHNLAAIERSCVCLRERELLLAQWPRAAAIKTAMHFLSICSTEINSVFVR